MVQHSVSKRCIHINVCVCVLFLLQMKKLDVGGEEVPLLSLEELQTLDKRAVEVQF